MVQFYSSKQCKVKSDNLIVIAESLDVKGQGVAPYQGKIIFITDLVPGEQQAQIQFTEEKRQFAKAKVSKRLTDSFDRVAPFCRHFGICGGCQQQHVTPALQRAAKISRSRVSQSPKKKYKFKNKKKLGCSYFVRLSVH